MKKYLKYWWKLLGIGLVAAASLAMMYIPLSSGILEVSPYSVKPGRNVLTIKGYNTNFKSTSVAFGYFANADRSFSIPFRGYTIEDDNTIRVSIDLPDTVRQEEFNLFLTNYLDGTVIHPNAIRASEVIINPAVTNKYYSQWPIKPQYGLQIPYRHILYETIRNLNFHVTMWFAMLAIMLISVIYSLRFLRTGNLVDDTKASVAANTGMLFIALGLITGSIWARFTWGAWWVDDPKLNGAAIGALVYLAYFVLRGSLNDPEKKARLSSVYNIFAFVILIVFIQVLPRLTDSLHPGNGGNPAFSQYDLNSKLRILFYPAVVGWILVAAWIWELKVRYALLKQKIDDQ